eukprot:Sdes_comp14920_c0_seq1m3613
MAKMEEMKPSKEILARNPFTNINDSRNFYCDSSLEDQFMDAKDENVSEQSFHWSIDDIAEFYPAAIDEFPQQNCSQGDISTPENSLILLMESPDLKTKKKFQRFLERQRFQRNMLKYISPSGKENPI